MTKLIPVLFLLISFVAHGGDKENANEITDFSGIVGSIVDLNNDHVSESEVMVNKDGDSIVLSGYGACRITYLSACSCHQTTMQGCIQIKNQIPGATYRYNVVASCPSRGC